MARRKETIWQNDFSIGAPRPESVERDDLPLIEGSVKEARNTISLSTGQIEGRPGTIHTGDTTATEGIEVDLGAGRVYDLHITPTGYVIYGADESVVDSETGFDWTTVTGKWGTYTFDDIAFWVLPDPDGSAILIGSQYFPIQGLIVDSAGSWTFGAVGFAQSLAGAVLQPYWRYYEGVTIQPSGRLGSINVTASSAIWTAAHVGMRIRYVDREIVLTGLTSSTVMTATVTEELPPTYTITVASTSGYKKGDVVEHSVLGGQGIITNISGSDITVLATSSYDGFNAASSPKLVAPNASQVISAVSSASPAATYLWDVQLQSPVHGYAGYATRHKNRAYLCGFPGAPNAFAASSAGSVIDFGMGPEDADGFVESIGSDYGGSLRYVISAEDLLFLTSRGLYYQQTRDGAAITPKNIGPIPFSRMGCAAVEPVVVDDGCIFVDSVGSQVYAAVLAGDIYRSWRAQPLAKYHSHLITGPQHLGATSFGSERPEQFIYVTNSDGTTAVCQWDRDANTIGWRPWDTDGSFVSVYQCFGKTYAIVDRTIADIAERFRERFEYGLYLDCVAAVYVDEENPEGLDGVAFDQGVTAFATHLEDHTATVYLDGWDLGDRLINSSGKPLDNDLNVIEYPDWEGIAQIGLLFETEVVPWDRRSLRTQRGTREIKRKIELYVTVQDSRAWMVGGRTFGGYRAGDDLTLPPPLRSEQIRVDLTGGQFYERVPIVKDRPGPFRLMKLGYRVVI